MLRSEQQFIIVCNEMLITETTVSSANLSTRVLFLLNFAGTTRGKQGQQLPYKLMAQDKDRSPLQFTGTAVLHAYE